VGTTDLRRAAIPLAVGNAGRPVRARPRRRDRRERRQHQGQYEEYRYRQPSHGFCEPAVKAVHLSIR
jgi:hypothetical protein